MRPALLLLIGWMSGASLAAPEPFGASPSAAGATAIIQNRLPVGDRVGAWGPGSFENDDAMDLLADLVDGGGMDVVQSAFDIAEEGAYLEAPEASAAVAAAEIVAALAGRPGEDLPEEAAEWVAANGRAPGEKLVRRARTVVERVRTDSELKELWEEGEEAGEWHAAIKDLLARLGADASGN